MIRIISGSYGYRENGHVVPKNSKSKPFSLDKKEEERLVKAGVAVYVDGEESTEKNDVKPDKDNKGGKGKKGANDNNETGKPQDDVLAPSFDAKGTVV